MDGEIISEASRHVPESLQERFPDIPWAAIRAVGNKLRHEYPIVDDYVIWRAATKNLPALQRVVSALLEQAAD